MPQKASTWHEWVITTALVLLSVGAVWAVFGDDLAQLVAPETPTQAKRVVKSP